MNDKLLLNLLLHFRAMWKYRWRGLYATFGVAIITAVLVMMIPKKYEAAARIYANTDSILKPLMAGMTVQPDINQRVAMLSRIVISRPNVEHIIQVTGLDSKVKTQEDRELLIDEVIKTLELQRVVGERNNNIYVVRFRDSKPERATHVVDLLVSMFIDTSKGGGATDTEAAKAFLDEQAAAYEKKLQEAESRLKEFRLKHLGETSSAEGRDFASQMAALADQLRQAQLQLREAENSRDAYRRGLAGEDLAAGSAAGPAAAGGDGLSDIDRRLDGMRTNLDGLLQRYTENHPDVTGARRTIRELEEQRRKLLEDYRKAGVPLLVQGAASGPRASEQIKISLSQAEAQVASLRARVGEYSTRYAELRDKARRMPEYEAELAQLNRDYEVNKRNYESLVSRREQANISGDMQSVAGVADFRLIDPPRVSPNPVFPNRPLLLVVTLILSLLAGGGVMFASKELRPCIYEPSQLREAFGLPILGVVSFMENDASKAGRVREMRSLGKVAFALGVSYVVVVVAIATFARAAI